jgi:hypothetical protein
MKAMPILPTNFIPGPARSGGVLGIPAAAAKALPSWLMDPVTALQLGGWPMHTGSPQAAPLVQPNPPSPPLMPAQAGIQNPEISALGPRLRGDERVGAGGGLNIFDQARAAIPQNLADNADALLAFGGGTLRGGLGLGASEAAKIGAHAAQLAQQRRTLAAQQAAALLALQARGIPDAAALAAMHPVLARVLLTRGPER